ncbi:MAG: NAD-dependent epimerase/dehydratase family protein [Clostridia bacterium]|nr:NAD-dependent epimerase/dehydratase family protein [Clostridia bacterium]
MHALVTGGAGFIGSHLVRRLVGEGHTVTVLDDLSTGQLRRLSSPGVRVVQGDVRDRAAVRTALQDADAVFHLAAVVGVPHAMAREWDSLTTNLLGTLNLLELTHKTETPIFIASSSAIYGKIAKGVVSEEDDVVLGNTHNPSWTYSYAKLVEELLARVAATDRRAKVKIGRFFNVIGPGQSDSYGMVVPRFIRKALRDEPLPVYGDGRQTRTFVDVEDAVDAALLVWERGEWGCAYNIGGQQEITILDLARKIIEMTNSKSEIQFIPYDVAFGPLFEETSRRMPSIGRIMALGYRPKRSLDESLAAVIDDIRAESERRDP